MATKPILDLRERVPFAGGYTPAAQRPRQGLKRLRGFLRPMTVRYVADVSRIALKSMLYGGDGHHWDASNRCEAPKHLLFVQHKRNVKGTDHLTRRGDYEPDGRVIRPAVTVRALGIHVLVPCRRCPRCSRVLKRMREQEWTRKATLELGAAFRTWFGTLTIRPEERYRAELTARQRAQDEGLLWEEIAASDQFTRVHMVYSAEITRFYKRVRKNSRALLRHLTVCEQHKDGAHHYHVLIHETSSARVQWKVLTKAWELGFSSFKLVPEYDLKSALYVCKYLSKESSQRVRCSTHYGDPEACADRLQTVLTVASQEKSSDLPAANKGEPFLCERENLPQKQTSKKFESVI